MTVKAYIVAADSGELGIGRKELISYRLAMVQYGGIDDRAEMPQASIYISTDR